MKGGMKDMEKGGNERYGDGRKWEANKRGGEGGMKEGKKGKPEGER